MACSRLLLLLVGLISSRLLEVQGRDIDFWCQAKNHLVNKAKLLNKDMANCEGSDTLHSPVQLCEGVKAAEWANKTLQQKSTEVMEALQVFQDGVRMARNHTVLQTPACQASLLEKLEHHVTNYVIIVKRLHEQVTHVQNDTSYPAVQHCSNQTSLRVVLKKYDKLLSGKVKRLADDLQKSLCDRWSRTHDNHTKGL